MKKNSPTRLLLLALAALSLSTPLVVHGADDETRKEISDEVSTGLGELKGFVDNKDYAGAVKHLDSLLVNAGPNSYDRAMVSQIKAQVLMTMGDYAGAIPAFQTAQTLGEKYSYFELKEQLSQLYLLCQLNYQLAADAKEIDTQKDYYSKAYAYLEKWLTINPSPTSDAWLFAASILYGHATIETGKPDMELIKKAREAAEQALYASVNPPEQAYVLLLAALQQLQAHNESAACLEVLVQRKPNNGLYWQQLTSAYLAQAAAATEEIEIRSYYMRTLLTMERAQENGFMNSPKDYMNMVGIYFNMEQFGKASDILAEGLKSGKIENTRSNWELLSAAFTQNGKDANAIQTLEQASSVFPEEGQIELSLGQMHYGAGRTEKALVHLEKAVNKGNLKKPGAAYLFLGFTAYELQRYEEAAKWAKIAGEHGDIKPDDAKRLARAAAEAIKDREELMKSKT